ncbi:MAG: sigma-54 dependent transcriptional regulator [Planctomycetota bacterium]
MSENILIIEDTDIMRDSLKETLSRAGYRVSAHAQPRKALEALAEGGFDCVLTDLKMPEMDGLEVLEAVKGRQPDLPVVLITAHGTVETAVRAMKLGAADYVTKPFKADDIERVVGRVIELRRVLVENEVLRRELGDRRESTEIVGESAPVNALRRDIERVGASAATVLIQGESGVGKELVARAIHEASPRKDKPFLAVNCAALSAGLLESELFGHEKGAFTGADRMRRGRFELADGGTILLDEVSEIETHLQGKLLRVLQERVFERVGSSLPRKADVRVLATTNRDLAAHVKAGKFREDLFFRLHVVPLRVPPLRERKGDIPLLVKHFLGRFGATGRNVDGKALALLAAYDWPGNVRELANAVERAVVLSAEPALSVENFELRLLPGGEKGGAVFREGVALADIERRAIREALAHFDGHRQKTAAALGIGLRTLTNKINEMKAQNALGGAQ